MVERKLFLLCFHGGYYGGKMRKIYKLNEADIKINGRHRFTESGALEINWSASGFEMNFKAERVNVLFVPDYVEDQVCYIGVYLDGGMIQKFPIVSGAETLMVENISSGEHHLKLVKLSEGNRILKIESIELVGDDAELLSKPEYSTRFEFLGDSITCGFGDIAEQDMPVFLTRDEDVTKTYAYLTAEHFNAELRIEAYSGQGIVRNCNGRVDYPIPHFFSHELRRVDEAHDFDSWTPDVVVINAGTNDCGGRVTDDEFHDGAKAFLCHIREVYPKAQIVWIYGMMGLRYEKVIASVVEELCDSNIHFLPVESISREMNEVGAVGHPNEKGQKRAAQALISKISELIG